MSLDMTRPNLDLFKYVLIQKHKETHLKEEHTFFFIVINGSAYDFYQAYVYHYTGKNELDTNDLSFLDISTMENMKKIFTTPNGTIESVIIHCVELIEPWLKKKFPSVEEQERKKRLAEKKVENNFNDDMKKRIAKKRRSDGRNK